MVIQIFTLADFEALINTPENRERHVVNYLQAGTAVWLVEPNKRTIEAYTPDHAPLFLQLGDALEGGPLPGFQLPLAEIFPE
ncbi:MAG: hypothetical protein OHK0046_11230 [Anaerolineae bacterium]